MKAHFYTPKTQMHAVTPLLFSCQSEVILTTLSSIALDILKALWNGGTSSYERGVTETYGDDLVWTVISITCTLPHAKGQFYVFSFPRVLEERASRSYCCVLSMIKMKLFFRTAQCARPYNRPLDHFAAACVCHCPFRRRSVNISWTF